MQMHDTGENQNVVGHEEQFARQGKIFEIFFLFLELKIKHTVIVANGIASNGRIVYIAINIVSCPYNDSGKKPFWNLMIG